ncbi:hypothetical protein KQX54_002602 [Cotesia glomerata]|uniref:Uncharacterized protein n=1 Tax=Cotesia glomerata TaxID=32391 RepID=A0AAV7IBR1_COTGL|nr:hypothetical protein KQX54_002602 [Cotesia glomerata]
MRGIDAALRRNFPQEAIQRKTAKDLKLPRVRLPRNRKEESKSQGEATISSDKETIHLQWCSLEDVST